MESFHKHTGYSAIKTAICIVFFAFSEFVHAQILGGPPGIAVQPLGLSVLNGGTAVLTATAISSTPMKLYWYCNGQPVPTSNSSVLNVAVPLVGTVSTLTIDNLSSANAGNYSLRVTNTANLSTISSNATLIVLVSVVTNVVDFVASETRMTASGFHIQLSGPSGSNIVIQASTDLKNWIPISTNSVSAGVVSYTDASAVGQPVRYYRAVMP